MTRCSFCQGNTLYEAYHDLEWGAPQTNDQKLFESLVLETFQAGLNWLTILKKRAAFRKAFDQFDIAKVALYSAEKISELLENSDIIRNRAKIESAINNSRAVLAIQIEHGSFANYLWAFTEYQVIQNAPSSAEEIPSKTDLSIRLSKSLKAKGFSFTGPVVMYAFLQANGFVNDHTTDCYLYSVRKEVKRVEL
ncbi:MAG: DNA-3-methyladenine glycosylase I [Bacteroidetes bacterium]|nr:DNA-3-methyladenine glycosylase I [Bacteroidota bacterium]